MPKQTLYVLYYKSMTHKRWMIYNVTPFRPLAIKIRNQIDPQNLGMYYQLRTIGE